MEEYCEYENETPPGYEPQMKVNQQEFQIEQLRRELKEANERERMWHGRAMRLKEMNGKLMMENERLAEDLEAQRIGIRQFEAMPLREAAEVAA